ncbi:TonB family protein [Hymenobacter gummosus]|uniref:TonB family protein n=1 Tax=Hymenobacter gummosus TaxID=1776032 RepID=A0A431TZ54_9BACT|nr:TonB family protein [Hymenobacter gummosus]RTQ47154.1 TonB family protein [Hymenobacter gummosus]
MLHQLPITNVRLLACHEDWQRMTPTVRGRHCRSCQREVIDFTQASAAELAAAQAAAPDGRVCGHFRRGQLAGGQPVRFGLWARAFVLTLALVLLQGLTARQAWAQTRKAAPKASHPAAPPLPPSAYEADGIVAAPPAESTGTARQPYVYVDHMPEPPGGQEAYRLAMGKQLRRPAGQPLAGKVFVSFIVQPDGHLTDLKVIRGLSPAYDAEALRLVQRLQPWTPGRLHGRAVPVSFTQVVVFGAAKK